MPKPVQAQFPDPAEEFEPGVQAVQVAVEGGAE
jgi:hypothetical protein